VEKNVLNKGTISEAPVSGRLPSYFSIVLKNFIKISLITKECPEEILIKLAFPFDILILTN
jgi:hypothetical protein